MNFFKIIIGSIKHWATEQISDLETKMNKALEQKQPIGEYAAKEDIPEVPVTSVNGQIGDVTIEIPKPFGGSWNDLTDKPFGEKIAYRLYFADVERTVKSPGNYTATLVPTVETGALEVGDTYNLVLADSDSGVFTAEWNGTFGEWIRPVREDGSSAEMGVKLTKNDDGTYKIDMYDNYAELFEGHISIDIYKAEAKTLDEKYIPDTIARKSDIPERFSGSWGDLTDKPVDEAPLTMEVNVPQFGTNGPGSYVAALNPVFSGGIGEFIEGRKFNISVNDFTGTGEIIDDRTLELQATVTNSNGKVFQFFMQNHGGYDYYIYTNYNADTAESILGTISNVKIIITSVDEMQEVLKKEYLPKAATVADAAGETVTGAEFNALLASLRAAGYLS